MTFLTFVAAGQDENSEGKTCTLLGEYFNDSAAFPLLWVDAHVCVSYTIK